MPQLPEGWKFRSGPSANRPKRYRQVPMGKDMRSEEISEDEYRADLAKGMEAAKVAGLAGAALGGAFVPAPAIAANGVLRTVAAAAARNPKTTGALMEGVMSAASGESAPEVLIDSALGALGGAGAAKVLPWASNSRLGRLIRSALPAADETATVAAQAAKSPAVAQLADEAAISAQQAAREGSKVRYMELPVPAKGAAPANVVGGPAPGIPVDQVESRVLDWATRGGLSRAQIEAALKEAGYNQERGMVKDLVSLIYRKHGLTRK